MIHLMRLTPAGNTVMRFSITNVVLTHPFADSARRRRCVPFASPPPPTMISSMGIVVSASALSISATAVGKSAPKDGLRMREELNLKAPVNQGIKHVRRLPRAACLGILAYSARISGRHSAAEL